MSEHSINHSLEELDNIPSVSFDIRLGKHFEYIDFDYVRYISYLKDRGVNGQQIDSTSVYFHPASNSRIGTFGTFYPDMNMTIGMHRKLSKAKINGFLRHETEHLIDYCAGTINEEDADTQVGHHTKAKKKLKFILGGMIVSTAGIALENKVIMAAGMPVVLGSFAARLRHTWAYRSSGYEKAARNAAKNGEQYIILERR